MFCYTILFILLNMLQNNISNNNNVDRTCQSLGDHDCSVHTNANLISSTWIL